MSCKRISKSSFDWLSTRNTLTADRAFLLRHAAMNDIAPSEELRSFMHRFYAALNAWDFDRMKDMVSTRPHSLIVGADPAEWWMAHEALEILRVQARELGKMTIRSTQLSAYVSGQVGWLADQPVIKYESGLTSTMRITAVVAIERGHWRFVQIHASFAQANEQSPGRAVTTRIDNIEQCVCAERPDVSQASAPDGTVTIVFSDIESSTVLLDRLNDTGFMRLLAWHDNIVCQTAEEHRGYVVKSQGDGFMLAFPSAAFALRASLVMRDRIAPGFDGLAIRIRAGMHSGEAIRHDDDFYGRTVVIAARISNLALGGEILVSSLVYELARGLGMFTFGDVRPAKLKGIAGDFELRAVMN